MRNLAIQQAVYIPLGAMLALIAFAFTVPGYHPVSQHLSEMGLMPGLPAKAVQVGPVVSGSAIILFSLALLAQGRRFALTVLTSTLFGVSMVSNGVFTIGSPMHGLYGVGIFSILTPLLVMTMAFTLLFLLLHLISMRTEILRRRATSLQRPAAIGGAR